MADNFTNPFLSAYLGTSDEPLGMGWSDTISPSVAAYARGNPLSSTFNIDIGPVENDPLNAYGGVVRPIDYQRQRDGVLRQSTDEYLKSIFEPAQTTEDYVAANPLTEEINMPSSSMVVGRPQAENTAQTGKRQSNYIQDAHNAVMELMKGGKAINAPRGSAMESAFQPEKYSRIERDIRGNIIGAIGKTLLNPVTGAPAGQIAPNWKARERSVGEPLTPE